MTGYNSTIPLPIANIPREDMDQELMDIHNSLEVLATKLADVLVSIEADTIELLTEIARLSTVTVSDIDYDIVATDYVVLLSDGATGTLPASASIDVGTRYEIKCIDANNDSYVAVDGADTLEDSSDAVEIHFPQSVTVVSSASGWWII